MERGTEEDCHFQLLYDKQLWQIGSLFCSMAPGFLAQWKNCGSIMFLTKWLE